ncbi:hypothetical protein Salat_1005900 [Sesamum alatum]|uniref:Uncharacterized protein n=1 Tax=Sesamum alatum TaxID=300844 RepID=A0AAE2CS47_9LAMI|nr:hypothetical protein Salat_1005900 [Sesamum alatum]
MDSLWFYHTILLSKHYSFSLSPEIPLPISQSSTNCSITQQSQLPISDHQQTSSSLITTTTCSSQVTKNPQSLPAKSTCFQESDHHHDNETTTVIVHDDADDDDDEIIRPSRSYIVPKYQTGSDRSNSPARIKQSRNYLGRQHSAAAGRLQKSMSCKSFGELELEEVKGCMDLGFTFKKDNLSERVINLVPGLQRFGFTHDHHHRCSEINVGDQKKEVMMMRPYLSEAWLIKRPDSPLLNLRIPRVSTTDDMKKHLKDWARTVASAVHQQS